MTIFAIPGICHFGRILQVLQTCLVRTLLPGWSQKMQYKIQLFFNQYYERTQFAQGGKGAVESPGQKLFSEWSLEAMALKLFGVKMFGKGKIFSHGLQCVLNLFATWSWGMLCHTIKGLKRMGKKEAVADVANSMHRPY
ncbi:hypothetical protein K435DRAFT_805752 [Dendrothele bispora CBS 962.96]|uniref:Uncharacterized protein n=1 Tax=Dendrothele bispora (strain CBS 962.96) TaxID=1314807 RepID=A0A4S8LA15_DENBC|nr:hypothetical protein K435DRAFT_805752 [Dendrothele bispora CBS 962.96]